MAVNRWNRPGPSTRRARATAAGAVPPFADLYARWAHASQWRGFRRGQPEGVTDADDAFVRVIAKAQDGAALQRALADSRLDIPALYAHTPPGAAAQPLHFTARLRVKDLAQLATTHPGLRWELAAPLREAETVSQADTAGRFGPTRRAETLRAPPLPRAATKAPAPVLPLKAAIGVIDFGCPFLNPRFADADRAGSPRVVALWDQDPRLPLQLQQADQPPPPDPSDPWWQRPDDTGYGRVLDAAALAQLHALTQQVPAMAEATLYRRIDYLLAYDDPRRRLWTATHGAHVLDMAGGRPDPLAAQRRRAAPAAKPAPDPAASAPLLFVQLPALTAADSSGGSLSACLLDALRYLLAQCADGAPLVANISYGTFAGPHDGNSLIESAMDELLRLRANNFAIVLGAGNGRQAGCHVRRTVRPQRSALLRMLLQPGDTTDTFVEIWYPRPDRGTPAPPLGVRVRTAARDWSEWAYPGQACTLADPSTGELAAFLQHADAAPIPAQAGLPPAQKAQQVLVLLALAPTAHAVDDEGPLAEAGGWEIEVAFKDTPDTPADAAVTFHAWVERDDPGDSGQGAQPRFFGTDRDDEQGTLSSIATGAHTVVVGGYRLDSGAPAAYSALPAAAAAPTSARALPLVYGPCEEDEGQQNLAGCAVRTGEVYRMNGTSVAAPVVARQLFNAMVAAGPAGIGRDDWPRVLKALAEDPVSLVRLPATS